jgi:hypothetical protein
MSSDLAGCAEGFYQRRPGTSSVVLSLSVDRRYGQLGMNFFAFCIKKVVTAQQWRRRRSECII